MITLTFICMYNHAFMVKRRHIVVVFRLPICSSGTICSTCMIHNSSPLNNLLTHIPQVRIQYYGALYNLIKILFFFFFYFYGCPYCTCKSFINTYNYLINFNQIHYHMRPLYIKLCVKLGQLCNPNTNNY